LRESTTNIVFFFNVLCGKREKHENTVLGYKKGSKVEINMIFEKFRG